MTKKLIGLALFSLCFFLALGQEANAAGFKLKKQNWVPNHTDTRLFMYNQKVCAAGAYANAIRTECTAVGVKNWKPIEELNNSSAEYINLADAFVWKTKLYYVLTRKAENSNNENAAVEVWRLNNSGWKQMMEFVNDGVVYLDYAATNAKVYIFVHRTNANPYTLYYSTTDGVNWTQEQAVNTPYHLTGVATLSGSIYGFDSSSVYKKDSAGTWTYLHSATNSSTERETFSDLVAFKGKLYLAAKTQTFDQDITSYHFEVKSSGNGSNWTEKTIDDTSLDGTEDARWFNSGKQLWLHVYRDAKSHDLLWRVAKNINLLGNNDKYLVPKTRAMRIKGYYTFRYLKTGTYHYFADNHGNIYKK